MAFRDCIITARDGGELPPRDADRLLRRLDELTASGLSPENAKQRLIAETEASAVSKAIQAWEGYLDRGLTPADAKAKILAGLGSSRDVADRVAAKLNASVVLEEPPLVKPPRGALTPDQEQQFAKAFPNLQTKDERLALLRQLTGDESIGVGTLKKVQRDLAERGLIEMQGVSKAVEPTVRPEFAIPELVRKKTRAAGKPVSGVFAATPDLAWTGLPTGEFRANLRHIAEKRARKADQAFLDERGLPPPVGDDLSTPEKVEAHIGEVLANPTFAQVRWRNGKPYEMTMTRLGAEGIDQVVGVSLHKGDGTGRLYIATAYNARREDIVRRLSAALEQNGPEAVKWQKAPDRLNVVLQLVEQVPTAERGPSWDTFKASLIREQAASRQRAIDPSDRGMRVEAIKALRDGQTVYPAPAVRKAVNAAVADALDILPEGVRVGALEKLEPQEMGAADPMTRATYRSPDGERFALWGKASEFTSAGAFFDPDDRVIVFNTFSTRGSLAAGEHAVRDLVEGLAGHQLGQRAAPAAGIPFDRAIRGLLFHEVLHSWWADLDDWVRNLLVDHANRLGVLEMSYRELWAKTHWDPHISDARGSATIREAYTEIGSSPEVLNHEAVAHMVQLAAVGALKADDLAPQVRQILEALFNGDQQHMARALAGETGPRMAGRLNALEGPPREDTLRNLVRGPHAERRIEAAQRIVATMVRRGGFARAEIADMVGKVTGAIPEPRELRDMIATAHQTIAEGRPRIAALTETPFMRNGDRQPRDPAREMLAGEYSDRQVIEILKVCRS